MRLASAPEQLLSTADCSLNDAFDGKAFTQIAQRITTPGEPGAQPSGGRWRDSSRHSEGNAMGFRSGMHAPLQAQQLYARGCVWLWPLHGAARNSQPASANYYMR